MAVKPNSSLTTMATFLSSVLAGSALLQAVNAQNFGGGSRDEAAFSWIQPMNTTILTEYGSSPPVYPSRKLIYPKIL
jgi:beta-glucosidase